MPRPWHLDVDWESVHRGVHEELLRLIAEANRRPAPRKPIRERRRWYDQAPEDHAFLEVSREDWNDYEDSHWVAL